MLSPDGGVHERYACSDIHSSVRDDVVCRPAATEPADVRVGGPRCWAPGLVPVRRGSAAALVRDSSASPMLRPA